MFLLRDDVHFTIIDTLVPYLLKLTSVEGVYAVDHYALTLLHSESPKLYTILAFLSARVKMFCQAVLIAIS